MFTPCIFLPLETIQCSAISLSLPNQAKEGKRSLATLQGLCQKDCGELWTLWAPEPAAALLISSCVNTMAQKGSHGITELAFAHCLPLLLSWRKHFAALGKS